MGNQLTEIAPNTPFLPNFQSLHVVVIGLDSAGKTSLLYRLKLKEFVETIPTKGFNTEKIKVPVGNGRAITLQVWDVGGQEKLRPLWKSYTRRTDGMVFVVDSTEVERMEEAKVELHKITRTSENQGVPVLVLANKQDLPVALPVSDVEKVLAVHELSASTLHHVQGCSAVDGQGLQPGLEKLYEMILKRKKMVKHSKKKRWAEWDSIFVKLLGCRILHRIPEWRKCSRWPSGQEKTDLTLVSHSIELLSSMPSNCCAAPLCNQGKCDSIDRL